MTDVVLIGEGVVLILLAAWMCLGRRYDHDPAPDWEAHCVHGHPFDDANTYVDAKGRRSCRACHRANEARRTARLPESEVAS